MEFLGRSNSQRQQWSEILQSLLLGAKIFQSFLPSKGSPNCDIIQYRNGAFLRRKIQSGLGDFRNKPAECSQIIQIRNSAKKKQKTCQWDATDGLQHGALDVSFSLPPLNTRTPFEPIVRTCLWPNLHILWWHYLFKNYNFWQNRSQKGEIKKNFDHSRTMRKIFVDSFNVGLTPQIKSMQKIWVKIWYETNLKVCCTSLSKWKIKSGMITKTCILMCCPWQFNIFCCLFDF
jgi:hypothetical protein